MYCIGLTGTIASGKSTVANFFKKRGITVISADEIARELTAPSESALQSIFAHFGDRVITSDKTLDRVALRKIIFNDPAERIWLEELLHPLIKAGIKERLHASQSPYTVVEIPLLMNKKDYPYLNRILVVFADHVHQVARVMARDHVSKEHAEAILAVQSDESLRQRMADDKLLNHGSLLTLEKHIEALHQRYLQFAKQAAKNTEA